MITIIKRNELKYYVNFNDYKFLFDILNYHLEQDKKALLDKGYIRSLYFDTLFNKAFEEKEAGILNRKKYRFRIYNLDSRMVKFEIKNKFNNQILKETALINRSDAKKIQNGNFEVLLNYNNPILNKIYCEFKRELYQPVILIDYTREAFIFPVNDIRITFDRNIKASSEDLDLFSRKNIMKPLLPRGILVMEVKYNHFLPLWIRKIIQIPRFERSAISKFCIGRMEQYV